MTTVLSVGGMSCKHCAAAVTDALKGVGGVSDVSVDLKSGKVTVTHNGGPTMEMFEEAVDEAGYEIL